MAHQRYTKAATTALLQTTGGIFGAFLAEPGVERVGYTILSLHAFLMLVYVGTSNPGTLLRQTEEYRRKIRFVKSAYEVVEHEGVIAGRQISLGSDSQTERFCTTCGIFRPAGTHHCRECRGCIAEMDHHCVWIGNCVGKENYPEFISLVTVEAFKGLGVLFFRIRAGVSFQVPKTWESSLNWVTLIIAVLQGVFYCGLWIYFILLFLKATTARSFYKRTIRTGGIQNNVKKFFNGQWGK